MSGLSLRSHPPAVGLLCVTQESSGPALAVVRSNFSELNFREVGASCGFTVKGRNKYISCFRLPRRKKRDQVSRENVFWLYYFGLASTISQTYYASLLEKRQENVSFNIILNI